MFDRTEAEAEERDKHLDGQFTTAGHLEQHYLNIHPNQIPKKTTELNANFFQTIMKRKLQ